LLGADRVHACGLDCHPLQPTSVNRGSRACLALAVTALLLAGSGCGGSGSARPTLPTIQQARTFTLAGFEPAGEVEPGGPTRVAFTIRQPSGQPLTGYRRGSGPHTGVHVIIVRSDLGTIIHRHPPISPNGRVSAEIAFPSPGRYRVVVDAYPSLSGPQRNFQLFRWISVSGPSRPARIPPFHQSEVVDGYRFQLKSHVRLKAIQASLLTFTVTNPAGRPARFTPWFGALAHAIFFRSGSLDYFHTHVCSPGASGCTSFLGGATVTGSSSTPGRLSVGVLVPVPGTWRLFLQCRADGRVVTASFTLRVS
jgi:hypothetical protein